MVLLQLEDLQKHYGAQTVLAGATLQVDPGEKIGIVGRNGGGKTTLLRLITGEETPDWGRVQRRKGLRFGAVPQRPTFDPGETVRQYVSAGLAEARRVLEELAHVAECMSSAEGRELERLMAEHTRLTERVESLGAWEIERRVETVLDGIGLDPALWDREARTLSGGEKSRVALARELAAGHELLLLDEPTNHLDLDGIEWIEGWLREMRGAVLIVSHDRRLLENAVDAIVELEHGRLRRYPGNYSRYLELRRERFESELRAWEQQQEKIRKEEAFIKKHMGSQRTSEAKGRLKRLRNLERLERPHDDVRRPAIRVPEAGRGGERVVTLEGVSFSYGDRPLLSDVFLRVGRGDRIGIVGRNGAGKSTLLRILAGRLAPQAGRVVPGHNAVCGYYDQVSANLSPDGTPLTELRRVLPQATDQELRDHLARFLFRGEEVDKPVSALSGGERARVALAQLVVGAPTWLALDEPTNHLDLAGRTALEEMLGEYRGALVCISHDREFLDGLANHIVEVSDGAVHEYPGNYSDWRASKLAKLDEQRARAEAEGAARKKERGRAAPEERAQPAEDSRQSQRKKPRNPWKLERIERRIIALEEELEKLHADLGSERVYRDAGRLRETQFRVAEVERELAEANEEWERLM